jgi:hypothetical protein
MLPDECCAQNVRTQRCARVAHGREISCKMTENACACAGSFGAQLVPAICLAQAAGSIVVELRFRLNPRFPVSIRLSREAVANRRGKRNIVVC